jgi:hypothetical protein
MVLGNDWQRLRDCWMDLKDKNGGFGFGQLGFVRGD